MRGLCRVLCGIFIAFSFTIVVAAQDLGSSNRLFGTKKTAPATKKPGAKPRIATSKTKKPASVPKTVAKKSEASPVRNFKPIAATTKPKSPTTTKTVQPVRASAKTAMKPKPKTSDTRFSEFRDAVEAPRASTGQPRELRRSVPDAEKRIEPLRNPSAESIDRFEDLIEEGNLARDGRNYVAAENAYSRAIPVLPRDSRAIYGLGNLYSDQQRWEQAEEAYRKALQIDSNSAIAHIALSYVLSQPVAARELSGRYEEAEKTARRAIQLAPSNALAFDQLGVALELRGQIGAETESAYRRAILLDTAFAPAYAHLGRLLRRRGQNKEADGSYKEAVKRARDAASLVLVAEVMQSEQRYADSEKLLEKALDDDPRNPSALLLLGRALTAQRKFSDSEVVLRRSLEVSPASVMANSLLGDLYAKQGKFEIAENSLRLALRFASRFERRLLSQQFEMIGDGYLKNNKRSQAERAYLQAIELDGDRETLPGKLSRARFGE